MNAIGVALIWCIVQITLLGILAAAMYLVMRRVRPAAAASVVLSSLTVVVVLSAIALSPWPRWQIGQVASDRPATASRSFVPAAKMAEPRGTKEIAAEAYKDSGTSSRQPPPTRSAPLPSKTSPSTPTETAKAEPVAPPEASRASQLWQTITVELSGLRADHVWRWPAFLAIVLFAAMLCGLVWFVLGMAAMRWQRRHSETILDAELSELIDVLRAELGCLRPVEVRESSDLVTAATIGWRRPVVLLPADWRGWTPEQRHAVLAHEIVHARSQDSVALLFGQLGLMLHCYHPLLHWLMGRLRLEQELAADAAAADISGGPRQYLSTIAEIALLTQDRRLSWPTRTFLPTRTTFLRRIAMLRGEPVRFDRVSPLGRLTFVATVALFGVLVAGIRGPGESSQTMASDAMPPTVEAKRPVPVAPKKLEERPIVPVQPATPVPPPVPLQTAVPTSTTPTVTDARLRYDFKDGETHYYEVKIAATILDEDVTHQGVLTYNVLASNDEQFTLKCVGALGMVSKPKANAMPRDMGIPRNPWGRMHFPRIPAPPGFFARGEPMRPQETTFDRLGRVIRDGESESLPLLLGKQVELVVERLPSDARPTWTMERDLGVIEREESSGPPYFGPFSRGGSETNRGAKERIEFTVKSGNQDSVRLGRKYSLKTAAEAGVTHIDMSGDGEMVFDRRLGVLRSLTMKYEIRVNESNVVVNIPFTLDCRRMTEAEVAAHRKRIEEQAAKMKAEAAARAEANKPRPLSTGEGKLLLRDLRSGDEDRVQKAAKRLSRALPDKNAAEFSKPLCEAYKHGDIWTQAAVMAALRVWASPDAEKTVIEGSRHENFMIRREAIPALGRFKTEAAAEAAAAQAEMNHREVEEAMKAMGPVAEKAAIAMLSQSNIWGRAAAANVLAKIGGKKALAALRKESRLHPHQAREVTTAIIAIEERLGDAADEADDSAKDGSGEEQSEESDVKAMRTWRAAAGAFTVRATFVELKSGKVKLRRADGHVIDVPLEKLSKADQTYAKEQAKVQEESENPFK